MDNTQILPFFKVKNHDKINFLKSYAKINSINKESFPEVMSVAKAKDNLIQNIISPKEAMQALTNLEMLKEAHVIFVENSGKQLLPDNITTVPVFSQNTVEREELSKDAQETFARIGARARAQFIEEQTIKAVQYNIPFNLENINVLELSNKIDEYEELLRIAKEYGIDWDSSEYDPVDLKQKIDTQELNFRHESNDLYTYFVQTRGLEV